MPSLKEKYAFLRENLTGLGRLGVAFSGGVDSTLLLKAAKDVLGENVIALTAKLHSVPEFELCESAKFCESNGIAQVLCEINELEMPEFAQNPPDRCYHCKLKVFSQMKEAAAKLDITHLAEGSNIDDLDDYRPGRRAVLECRVKSPLLDAGLTKADIRELSHQLGLATWDKPAYACLASRIPSGEPITEEKLRMVEKSEGFLISKGIREMRVRIHGDSARIEVAPRNIEKLASPEFRAELVTKLKEFGFRYVSLDLEGYKTGSMNPKGK